MMQILLISVLVRFGHGAQYEVTEEACANDLLFISSAEECEAAANALGITWNSCCQNNDNLPYGCLKRSDNDVIWNGNADTPNQFPCTVDGNCDHGMRWAVCYEGDDSVFESEAHETCCVDGWISGTDCQGGCWNCACSDGGSQCGCIHLDNVYQSDYLQESHLVVQGRTSWGGWGSAPDSYCQSDDDNQAAYDSSKHSRDIGVGCCSMDGTTGYRPDCNAHAATYHEAEALCADNNMRLCTEQEMLYGKSNGKGITEGTGCWYDAAYQWVSDECVYGTDAAGFGLDYEPDNVPWTVTLSGKDLLILLLVAINVVTIVAVCCVCAQPKRHGAAKYKVVRTVGDSEMDSEDISLRQ